MKYLNLGYITRLSYAELLYPRIQVPLLQSRSLGVRTAFQLEGASSPWLQAGNLTWIATRKRKDSVWGEETVNQEIANQNE